MPKDLNTKEVAKKLNVAERTVRNMIRRGSINAYKLDPTAKSVYFIPADEVERILRERAQTQSRRARS